MFLGLSGLFSGLPKFFGDVRDPLDRYYYGMNSIVGFYDRYRQAIDAARRSRQYSTPDPYVGH